MKVVFISGPYRAPTVYQIQQNINAARAVALRYWEQGYAVICPHANTALMDGALPDHVWLDGDIELVKRCDVIVMMRNWRSSCGALQELATARTYELDVIFDEETE